MAASSYVEELEGRAALITMGAATSRDIDALGRICDALGAGIPSKRDALDTHRRIVDRLQFGPNAPPDVLIIGEAHYLDQNAANCIRDLADQVRIGVAFIGNLDLYDRWFPAKAGARVASEQFISRIGPCVTIRDVSASDVRQILAARNIKGEPALAFLARIAAASPGRLCAVDNTLRLAAHNANGTSPDLDDLKIAAGMCGIKL
jgi:hypothetical protein